MANRRYGLKEVADVVFYNIATGKPEIFFDTLKVSTIENESESDEARGGQGNNRLMSWDYGRTSTLTLQDALLSDVSLAMLAGTDVKTDNIIATGKEILEVKDGNEIELSYEPNGDVIAYEYKNGLLGKELDNPTVESGTTFTFNDEPDTPRVMVFYDYIAGEGATKVTFAGNRFPATYRVVGETIGRGEDGLDRRMQFEIPKAKLQSTFSLTMDVENVSVFDFTLEVLTDGNERDLYHIIHLPYEND